MIYIIVNLQTNTIHFTKNQELPGQVLGSIQEIRLPNRPTEHSLRFIASQYLRKHRLTDHGFSLVADFPVQLTL